MTSAKKRKKAAVATLGDKPKKPRKPKPPPVPFNAREVLAAGIAALEKPPALPHIVRVPGVGELYRRFALPLELCPTTNTTRHQPIWMLAKTKKNLFAVMLAQTRMIRNVPLPGRPMLRCVRFSSKEPDKYSDWMKMAIDRLLVGKERLGYFRDDSPEALQVEAWWEPSEVGCGSVILEIYTGAVA